MSSVTRALMIGLAVGACAGGRSQSPEARVRPPTRNVLLVIADDLGVDRMRAYAEADHPDYYRAHAARVPTTPTLDALARYGVRFASAWSMPLCSPTRATLYTGRYPFRTGVGFVVLEGWPLHLDEREQTFARRAPVPSALFGKWHLGALGHGQLSNDAPREFGWARHRGPLGGTLPDYYAYDEYDDGVGPIRQTIYATERQARDAGAWITAQTGPWIATLAFSAPHAQGDGPGDAFPVPPPVCPGPTDTLDDRFVRTVECMDHYLGELLAGLEPATLAQTTIVFLGDNGTASGAGLTAGLPSYGPFAGLPAKGTVYEGGIHVPLVITDGAALAARACPTTGAAGCGTVVRDPVSVADLFPTVLELAGADDVRGTDGVSLRPYLDGGEPPRRAHPVYSEWFDADGRGPAAIRIDDHKLIVRVVARPADPCRAPYRYPNEAQCCSGGACELFDLGADPLERHELLAGGSEGDRAQCQILLRELRALHDDERTARCR